MKNTRYLLLLILIACSACYNPPRDCTAYKEGTFRFTAIIDGEEKTTTFERSKDQEIDYFEGKADTSSIRWINDCEYIVKKIRPRDAAEEKSIHMKILTTTDSSYTFEYGLVGSANKSKGIAYKVN
ncbi:DNA topoisomerase IV [Muriicola soli]|uniref:DNA topoisomerase IV n=1 Tax=Muriicola soli TaxID=2507538 RepID=A0A411E9M6_9FLAO|nr:DNA topoisomerase IV [Muriicola soli]QBA64243.1 DNA topoisomerase IV [Muriicola soli]